jgi:hypothetical protein
VCWKGLILEHLSIHDSCAGRHINYLQWLCANRLFPLLASVLSLRLLKVKIPIEGWISVEREAIDRIITRCRWRTSRSLICHTDLARLKD